MEEAKVKHEARLAQLEQYRAAQAAKKAGSTVATQAADVLGHAPAAHR